MEDFLEKMALMEVSAAYVVFKPVRDLREWERAVVVVFVTDRRLEETEANAGGATSKRRTWKRPVEG